MKLNRYNWHNQRIGQIGIGRLVPTYFAEVTPGDVWSGSMHKVMRLAPLDKPLYMQLNIQESLYYVPYRLLFPEFPEVWTGEDTTTAWPTLTYGVAGTLMYLNLGIPTNSLSTPTINALPIRAYNHIWNNHYRNPLLQAERDEDEVATLGQVHFPPSDYYGSLQNEVQQGTEEKVTVTAGEWTTTDARDAFANQRYKERREAYGNTYEDVLRTEFGQNLGDVRLQRAEHIARGRTVMGISEVVATATSASENTGEYRGHGIATMQTTVRKHRFKEPGCIFGVAYARPRLQLTTGLPHHFNTKSREDYYQPGLNSDNIVTVPSSEVYFENTSYSNFAYTPRWEHLRRPFDTVIPTGDVTDMCANVNLTSTPTLTYLQQVQTYDHIFQSAGDSDIVYYSDNRMKKYSHIPKRRT